ncbi:Retrovirus-related Pol polyprotein from transposon 297 [Exaiptasia diaphana]|nr:Retrovirus-related Pol polyprotein from transposon 297 [Exaiptasia diaphana]
MIIQYCHFKDGLSIGVGAVILQPEQGTLKPVAFDSRVLTDAEKKYSQIEKELLAIVFGATKFRQYLLGRHFTLKTDHKPLITLCGEHKTIPQMASSRIKRWTLLSAAYDYTIEFIPGKENNWADFLSRSPIEGKATSEEKETVQLLFTNEEVIKAEVVASETRKDPILKCYTIPDRKNEIQPTEITTTEDTIPTQAPVQGKEPNDKPVIPAPSQRKEVEEDTTKQQSTSQEDTTKQQSTSQDTVPELTGLTVQESRYPRRDRKKPDRLMIGH